MIPLSFISIEMFMNVGVPKNNRIMHGWFATSNHPISQNNKITVESNDRIWKLSRFFVICLILRINHLFTVAHSSECNSYHIVSPIDVSFLAKKMHQCKSLKTQQHSSKKTKHINNKMTSVEKKTNNQKTTQQQQH